MFYSTDDTSRVFVWPKYSFTCYEQVYLSAGIEEYGAI